LALKDVAGKQMIVAEKTRTHTLQDAEFAVWDLMIHSIDTALWLMDEPVTARSGRLVRDAAGNLLQGYLTVQSEHSQVQVITNMDANANLEQVTVQGAAARLTSGDLLQLTASTTAGTTITHRPDWEPVLETRGFAAITRAFLTAVAQGGPNPVSPESAIASHQACADLLRAE
jgi:virulence factor